MVARQPDSTTELVQFWRYCRFALSAPSRCQDYEQILPANASLSMVRQGNGGVSAAVETLPSHLLIAGTT